MLFEYIEMLYILACSPKLLQCWNTVECSFGSWGACRWHSNNLVVCKFCKILKFSELPFSLNNKWWCYLWSVGFRVGGKLYVTALYKTDSHAWAKNPKNTRTPTHEKANMCRFSLHHVLAGCLMELYSLKNSI